MKTIKVGILYICTGRYSVFWDRFYHSAEEFLLTENDIEKHYFIFTDSEQAEKGYRIHRYFKNSEGFPSDSIKRFEMFLSIQEDLKYMDYVYFLNANMNFVQKVGKEILPVGFKSGLVGVLHPGYFQSGKEELPYERNPDSKAFIPNIEGHSYHYFMGGFNGGKTDDFLTMCLTCSNNIREDAKNNIVACFHDESHINAYFLTKNILILSPEYGFPEDLEAPFTPKVIILNKAKHYGGYFIKEYANPFLLPSPFKKKNGFGKIKSKIKKIISKIRKYLNP
ncbi:hypothetical protein H8B06_13350 [Sphingobacterium sp. DN00404]|uniref:Glycosyl transferase family 6 n=1 Tax=Sphingobacterium micropteri TaxID=2763501 RepID=A0ABR7YRC7_9SPHI|nr:family 6 glucosyltransferase [Sphingobacterium micropteri]MBD1433817.1 hypothetical protein [Sphingobacterium micropteri]